MIKKTTNQERSSLLIGHGLPKYKDITPAEINKHIPLLLKELNDEFSEIEKTLDLKGEKDNIIKKAAERYAIQMTVMNHFDYADYAKSKALRSKVG